MISIIWTFINVVLRVACFWIFHIFPLSQSLSLFHSLSLCLSLKHLYPHIQRCLKSCQHTCTICLSQEKEEKAELCGCDTKGREDSETCESKKLYIQQRLPWKYDSASLAAYLCTGAMHTVFWNTQRWQDVTCFSLISGQFADWADSGVMSLLTTTEKWKENGHKVPSRNGE